MNRKTSIRSATAILAVACLALIGIQPAHAAKTKITIWAYGNVIQKDLEAEYEKNNPTIDIVVSNKPMDTHHQTLITALKAQKTPDIAAIEISYAGFFRSYPQYFQSLSGLLNENDYLDWRWEQGVAKNGTLIGIPTDVGGLQVAYRKDLFKKRGLPTDRVAVGKLWPTWEAFINTGKTYMTKLTTTEKNDCRVKKVCTGFIDNAGTIYSAILNQGTKKYYESNGTLIYQTNPNVKTAFTTTAAAMNAGISTRINQLTTDWNVGMTKGLFATVLAPAWMLDHIKKYGSKTTGLWDVADLPGEGGNLGGTQLTVPAKAKYSTQAKAFIKWYLSPATQLKMFQKHGIFPAASSLYSNPALTGYKDKFFSYAPTGQIYATGAKKLRPIFEGKNQRAIDNYFGQALAKVAVGKMTASAAWSDAVAQISKNIKN